MDYKKRYNDELIGLKFKSVYNLMTYRFCLDGNTPVILMSDNNEISERFAEEDIFKFIEDEKWVLTKRSSRKAKIRFLLNGLNREI